MLFNFTYPKDLKSWKIIFLITSIPIVLTPLFMGVHAFFYWQNIPDSEYKEPFFGKSFWQHAYIAGMVTIALGLFIFL